MISGSRRHAEETHVFRYPGNFADTSHRAGHCFFTAHNRSPTTTCCEWSGQTPPLSETLRSPSVGHSGLDCLAFSDGGLFRTLASGSSPLPLCRCRSGGPLLGHSLDCRRFSQTPKIASSIKLAAAARGSAEPCTVARPLFNIGWLILGATGQSFDVDMTLVSSRQGVGAATVQSCSPYRATVEGDFVASHPA